MDAMQFGSISCVKKMQGLHPTLNTAERVVTEYILANTRRVLGLMIQQLAGITGISYSTICRFCRKLGFNGYKELKAKLTEDVLNNNTAEKLDVSAYELVDEDSIDQICHRTFQLFNGILNDCASLLNLDTLERAVKG